MDKCHKHPGVVVKYDDECPRCAEQSPKFKYSQLVKHVKTGLEYKICEEPNDKNKLEYCNESFYAYYRDGVMWYRRKSEMEDGRFKVL